jgi:hypothetical protein
MQTSNLMLGKPCPSKGRCIEGNRRCRSPRRHHRGVGRNRTSLPLFRHLAAHHQYGHHDHYHPYGVCDSEHANQHTRGGPAQAGWLIRANKDARNVMLGLEDLTEEDLKRIKQTFALLAVRSNE